MNNNFIIDIKNLTKSFNGKLVVDGVNLSVPQGKIYGFLGPNGSGKTTTLRLICGLLTPDSGSGSCLGFDIIKQPLEIKKRIGYMTQKFSYWSDLSIRENLEFVAKLYGLDNIKKRVDASLKSLNLADRQSQLAGQLSGGWKQRLALAACILHAPKLLLLDEPTAGVDPKARREFWDEIHQLANQGVTILVSTHYMDEAERCHEIVYLSYGKLVTQGTVNEVLSGSGLHTWIVRGPNIMDLKEEIIKLDAVTTAAPFGDSLKISGIDASLLKEALTPYMNDDKYDFRPGTPSFEDVFIHYMSKVKDNFTSQEEF